MFRPSRIRRTETFARTEVGAWRGDPRSAGRPAANAFGRELGHRNVHHDPFETGHRPNHCIEPVRRAIADAIPSVVKFNIPLRAREARAMQNLSLLVEPEDRGGADTAFLSSRRPLPDPDIRHLRASRRGYRCGRAGLSLASVTRSTGRAGASPIKPQWCRLFPLGDHDRLDFQQAVHAPTPSRRAGSASRRERDPSHA